LVSGRLPESFKIGCAIVSSSGGDSLNWSQRYKANLEKLASGNLIQVVEVVRDLAGRQASRGRGAPGKPVEAQAPHILLQEG
jgi:CarD family transcriptional regulator